MVIALGAVSYSIKEALREEAAADYVR